MEEQVDGACEMLGLDPLYVANEGVFICIVEAEVADEVLSQLKSVSEFNRASIIGKVTKENQGKVIMKSKVGGTRMVNFLPGEQLPRIC